MSQHVFNIAWYFENGKSYEDVVLVDPYPAIPIQNREIKLFILRKLSSEHGEHIQT